MNESSETSMATQNQAFCCYMGIMWLPMAWFEFDCNLLLDDLKLESFSARCMWSGEKGKDETKGRRERGKYSVKG